MMWMLYELQGQVAALETRADEQDEKIEALSKIAKQQSDMLAAAARLITRHNSEIDQLRIRGRNV